jgi:response regulator NasT
LVLSKALTIAIAEDDSVIRSLLCRQLTSLGHRVVIDARSAEELLGGLSVTPVDLVISDINMAMLDGIDAADLIAARYGIPIIFISGIDFDTIAHRFGDCPAAAYLEKPFGKQELKAAIVMAMRRFEQARQLNHETAE